MRNARYFVPGISLRRMWPCLRHEKKDQPARSCAALGSSTCQHTADELVQEQVARAMAIRLES